MNALTTASPFHLEMVIIGSYTPLPDNASELNDYMCGPLNRKGRLCSECKDGYGLGTTSVGYQYFECTKCAGAWYGVPLFLFLEMFPLTVLYLIILLFQVNITSGSITCFIFYSQLSVIAFDRVFDGDDPLVSGIIHAIGNHSVTKWLFNALHSGLTILRSCNTWRVFGNIEGFGSGGLVAQWVQPETSEPRLYVH